MAEPNKYLIEIHKIIVDWLKFAEAKNAGLLTGNLVSIFGVSKLEFFSGAHVYSWAWWYYTSIVFFCGLSALCCLLSIVPQIEIPWFWLSTDKYPPGNLVFFGSIANQSPENYSRKLQEETGCEFKRFEKDLAEQIVVNSKIARRKFSSFKVSAWLTLSGFITPVISGLLILLREK